MPGPFKAAKMTPECSLIQGKSELVISDIQMNRGNKCGLDRHFCGDFELSPEPVTFIPARNHSPVVMGLGIKMKG